MLKNKIVYSYYSDYKFKMSKARGSYIWDEEGRKILDFTTGWNVANLGWNNAQVNEAVIRQARKNVYSPMWIPDQIQEDYAAAILDAYPGNFDAAIRTTGGTEANEVAMKLARAYTGRKKIIGFKDTYHGQLFGSMALGFASEDVQAIGPLVANFIQLDYPTSGGDLPEKSLEQFNVQLEHVLSSGDVAAIFVEPGIVTGWGACRIAPPGFLSSVRSLTKKYGTLMVVDEVGTGFSRTGKLFGMSNSDIEADIVTLAKAITNGAGGMGAVLTKGQLVVPTIQAANYTSTFGWTPLACAAALETLKLHQDGSAAKNAGKMGKVLTDRFQNEPTALKVEVRGVGLELCIDFSKVSKEADDFARKVTTLSLANGLNVVASGEGNIQLMPPCTITRAELDEGVSILLHSIKSAFERQ